MDGTLYLHCFPGDIRKMMACKHIKTPQQISVDYVHNKQTKLDDNDD